MKIAPDSIPEDTAPLTENAVNDSIQTDVKFGMNVFVSLIDGRSVVGKMLPAKKSPYLDAFTVGTSDEIFTPKMVKSVREV